MELPCFANGLGSRTRGRTSFKNRNGVRARHLALTVTP